MGCLNAYTCCLLLVWRMFIEIQMGRSSRLSFKLKTAARRKERVEGTIFEKKHYGIVQFGYLIFYILIIAMGCTGLIMAFEDVPFFKSIHDPAKEIHELLQWAFYSYAVIHIAGVVWTDAKLYNGLTSRMIHGKNKQACLFF
ncbi:MAG: cytochrome b/b6 domain-containing protein [Chitinophagaceae bacterium]|nr:cytochrome b/b6 domain-containing protein [Chitinophagaceae bacterium]